MRIIHILPLFVLPLFFPVSAHAQSPFQGGMKYTAVKKAPNAAPAEPKKFEESAESAEEGPASRVWKKYRALAAGEESAPINPEIGLEPETLKEEKTETPLNPSGFASIIQKYEQSKEQRSQLRSIKIDTPTPPQVPPPAKK